MKKVLLFVAMAVAAFSAHASMTYSPFLFDGYDAGGTPIADGTFVMVLDVDGDGWNGFDYLSQAVSPADNSSSWLWDTDDKLMDRGQIVNGEAFPFSTFTAASVPGFDANVDHYYVMWFDTAYNVADIGPGVGVNYGVEDLGTVGTDPGDYGPFLVGGNAVYQTVPEPASALLVLLGGGAVYALRRRGHYFVS